MPASKVTTRWISTRTACTRGRRRRLRAGAARYAHRVDLIGDTVNVAARVEQLTKTTGDTILLTHETVDALSSRSAALTDRGSHALKGKSAAVHVFALNQVDDAQVDPS